MRARYINLLLFQLVGYSSLAQSISEASKSKTLDSLKTAFENSYRSQKARATQYAIDKNIPLVNHYTDGTIVELVDVNQDGQPIYRSTFNQGSGNSMNIGSVKSGGSLGLDLKGSGIEIGVWDGAPVFEHDEFRTRIKTREGGTAQDHATHVAGTILATGINGTAIGMASEATLHSFDWNNDRGEMISMARPDQTSLLFSNHSYGLVHGWNCQGGSCTWTGNPNISDKEDWRFGFYTTLSRDLDQIAFNAPYYSIFWAAGNDRDDVGSSAYPTDGNQGSGYDCIVQEGAAKNVFTIGAVRKAPNYTSPSSVEMSSFSNWGPTDDGRIKPDLVAPGVSIYSTVTNNSYSFLSGTSMATPGAAGSLLLLQELHKKLNGGKVMRSSTLKALAIHTAKEAGLYPGPDYSFGWGLIDIDAAAKILLGQDSQNIFVEELKLSNNQAYELIINPLSNTKITATIAWTDPAGTPVGASLDPKDLMLINDLDIRIIDEGGNTYLPWALNPELSKLGEGAYKADNFRDNVEKIEFDNPEQRPYKIRISHKGTLAGGAQEVSLILNYTSSKDSLIPIYWVGGGGDWEDPSHWSISSGGSPSMVLPTAQNRVIIDENSFNSSNNLIQLKEDTQIGSLTWLDKLSNGIALNSHTLSVSGNLIFGSAAVTMPTEGKIVLLGSASEATKIIAANNEFPLLSLEVNGGSNFTLSGNLKVLTIRQTLGNLS